MKLRQAIPSGQEALTECFQSLQDCQPLVKLAAIAYTEEKPEELLKFCEDMLQKLRPTVDSLAAITLVIEANRK